MNWRMQSKSGGRGGVQRNRGGCKGREWKGEGGRMLSVRRRVQGGGGVQSNRGGGGKGAK